MHKENYMFRLITVLFAIVCFCGCFSLDASDLRSAQLSLDNSIDSFKQLNRALSDIKHDLDDERFKSHSIEANGRAGQSTPSVRHDDVPAEGVVGTIDVVEKFLSGKGDEVIVGRWYRYHGCNRWFGGDDMKE
jgi:hypothetical protein